MLKYDFSLNIIVFHKTKWRIRVEILKKMQKRALQSALYWEFWYPMRKKRMMSSQFYLVTWEKNSRFLGMSEASIRVERRTGEGTILFLSEPSLTFPPSLSWWRPILELPGWGKRKVFNRSIASKKTNADAATTENSQKYNLQ